MSLLKEILLVLGMGLGLLILFVAVTIFINKGTIEEAARQDTLEGCLEAASKATNQTVFRTLKSACEQDFGSESSSSTSNP